MGVWALDGSRRRERENEVFVATLGFLIIYGPSSDILN